jgi:hypothetical protein
LTSPCSLCGSSLTPVLDETALWQVWLNVNQNLLGKLVIVLKRHEEQVARLSAAEWVELHTQVQRTTERLRSAFAPDHFNYAFLQNQDRTSICRSFHAMRDPGEVSGVVFDDPDYPDHYAVPGRERRVSAAVLAALAELL